MTTKTNLAQPTYNSLNWDSPLNSNFGIINASAGGLASVNATSNYALSATEAQNAFITVTNSSGSTKSISLASVTGLWTIYNNSSYTLNVYAATGYTGSYVVIQPATSQQVYSADGANALSADSNTVQKTGDTMSGALYISTGANPPFYVNSGQFQVSGGSVYTTGNFYANQNVTAYSDIRFKENIISINDALAIVEKMNGVFFTRKEDGSNGVGVIAQEMQEVLPEVVVEGQNGHLAVAYGNITAVLINAVKELSARVKELEAK